MSEHHTLFLFERLVEVAHDLPGARGHEAGRWVLPRPGQGPHLGARDEEEVVLLLRVEEVHRLFDLVVGGHAERDDLQLGQTRGHRQYLNNGKTAIFIKGKIGNARL